MIVKSVFVSVPTFHGFLFENEKTIEQIVLNKRCLSKTDDYCMKNATNSTVRCNTDKVWWEMFIYSINAHITLNQPHTEKRMILLLRSVK